MSPVRSSGETLPNLAMVWTLKAMLAKTKALGPVTAPSLLCRGLAADFEAGMAAQKRRYARSSAVAGPNARSLEFRVAGAPAGHRDGFDEAKRSRSSASLPNTGDRRLCRELLLCFAIAG